MRDCPADAITITKMGTDEVTCEIDLSRCIYCAQCVDSCPKDALRATREFELASLQRDKLKVTFHGKCAARPAPAKPPVPADKKP
jgi:formate hydrogenlyase subunit 6/NADH:ubiquinone oxidoreductase subunit I